MCGSISAPSPVRSRALLPAGFYYKTFKWPSWQGVRACDPAHGGNGSRTARERRRSLRGSLAAQPMCWWWAAGSPASRRRWRRHARGPACSCSRAMPTSAARLAGAADPEVAGLVAEARRLGVQLLTRTLAFGVYDHNLVCACESVSADGRADLPACVLRERLWKTRARAVIAAAGAFERPLHLPGQRSPRRDARGRSARNTPALMAWPVAGAS